MKKNKVDIFTNYLKTKNIGDKLIPSSIILDFSNMGYKLYSKEINTWSEKTSAISKGKHGNGKIYFQIDSYDFSDIKKSVKSKKSKKKNVAVQIITPLNFNESYSLAKRGEDYGVIDSNQKQIIKFGQYPIEKIVMNFDKLLKLGTILN